MVFTVVSMNKNLDMYEIVSSKGEKSVVSSAQILSVLIRGYNFSNVSLTSKGFAVETEKGTRYVQVGMSRETHEEVQHRLVLIKQAEQQRQAQLEKRNLSGKKVQLNTTPKNTGAITYRGQRYISVESLCKKFSRDPEIFKKLYNMGYSMDECLGLAKLRPSEELRPRESVYKMLDKIESERKTN
jgi:hypothetical protein